MSSNGSSSQELCGLEPFLAGLSPGFWSHVPMCIVDIHNMKMVDGVNGIISKNRDKHNNETIQFCPISKCTILGTVVYADSKGNNSSSYVLDDGTGWIDCIVWSDNEGIYSLPRLVNTDGQDSDIVPDELFAVGELVRISGRLQCISISESKQNLILGEGNCFSVRNCMHEVHARVIEKVSHPFKNVNGLNMEAKHWVMSITGLQSTNLQNNLDLLEWLGPEIKSDVQNRRNFPSADDTLGSWKIFGVSCQCRLSYRDALLYCHCQAKPEPLDPFFTYRDRLLELLLQMESANKGLEGSNQDLRFQYKTILNNAGSNAVATEVARQTETSSTNPQRVVSATFWALRQDGIIYLLDEQSDTYLFISRENVLEPYIKRSLSRRQRSLPFYLRNVPRARLQYVKRCLRAEMNTTA